MTVHTPAVVDREHDIIADEVVPGTFRPYRRLVSLDPGIATVDQYGKVTRTGNGTARILCKTRHLTRSISVSVVRDSGVSASVFTSYASGSAAADATANIDGRLGGAISKPIYSTQNHATEVYVRNVHHPLYGVDLSCASPYSAYNGTTRGATLISPRHVIATRHAPIGIGDVITFVSMANVVVQRTVVDAVSMFGPGWDYDVNVALLESDIPESIKYAKILPLDWADYLPSLSHQYRLPALVFDAEEKGLVADLMALNSRARFTYPTDPDRQAYYEDLITGDSSNPAFLVIGDEAVLLTCWTFGGAGVGPNLVARKSDINAMMDTLGGGYQLTEFDLSEFTEF